MFPAWYYLPILMGGLHTHIHTTSLNSIETLTETITIYNFFF